ncbi:MAG: glycosyltransferase [Ferruginibacter sp.]
MKVLYIIDSFGTGGAEKSLLEITSANSRVNSYFLALHNSKSDITLPENKNVKIIKLNIPRKTSFSDIVKKVIPYINEFKPDIIHSTLYESDMIARKLKKHFKIPIINSLVSNSYSAERYAKLNFVDKLKLKYSEYLNRFTANADMYFSNSETIKKSNSKTLKINADKIKVIYRGRDPHKIKDVSLIQIQELREALNLGDKKVILNVSRLLKLKGQDELIKAFSIVYKDYPNYVLLIAGEGPFKSQLAKLITDLGLEDKVFLLGNRTDIPVLLNIADVFAYPSHVEGLPGALIEAMFAGKLIVCSDIPENQECVTNKEATFFRKGNIQEMSEILANALKGDKSFEQKKEIARETAFQKFDIASIANQYYDTYKEIISNYKN